MGLKYRFILASNKFPKITCPHCGSKKHWQRYLDIETGEVLPAEFGLCDNVNKCGQGLNPYKVGYAKRVWFSENEPNVRNWRPVKPYTALKPIVEPELVLFPETIFSKLLQPVRYKENVFIQNLLSTIPFPFEASDIEKVISQYYLGTIANGYRKGAITFPYIDENRNIRTVQVKQFDHSNHTTKTDFLHAILKNHYEKEKKELPGWLKKYLRQDKFVSCLFGEHLLRKYPNNPVALVEAPKSAIYATLYFGFPDVPKNLLWLAVYNKSSFTFEKLKVLKGRKVIVFPDLSINSSTYKMWKEKAINIEAELPGTRFIFSDLLERNAGKEDRIKGLDIADYLITKDWRKFRPSASPSFHPSEEPKPLDNSSCEKRENCEAQTEQNNSSNEVESWTQTPENQILNLEVLDGTIWLPHDFVETYLRPHIQPLNSYTREEISKILENTIPPIANLRLENDLIDWLILDKKFLEEISPGGRVFLSGSCPF